MKLIRKAVLLLSFAIFVAAPVFSFVTPANSFAAGVTNASQCEKSFLGIQPWFRGLAVVNNGQCSIASPGQLLADGKTTLDLTGFIWRIALNVIDIGLAVVGYIAFFFVLYGGFQFLTGGNNPSQIEKARKTILNAVVGLVISLGAVAIINLVFGIIG
ncbi:MAG: hypothetical protein JWN12_467 [Candidatus Saccharibacteria bacterium]|nr:hypothetical protein [Candidatus Saccharibacteria bacterium]